MELSWSEPSRDVRPGSALVLKHPESTLLECGVLGWTVPFKKRNSSGSTADVINNNMF